MLKMFSRWLQLTFLFFIGTFSLMGLFMGSIEKGEWSRFAIAAAIGAVLALVTVRRMARTAAMTRNILPLIPAGLFQGSGGGGGYGDHINPATGLPMMFDDDFGVDVGGNMYGTTSASDSDSFSSDSFSSDDD